MTSLERLLTYYNQAQPDSMQAAIVRNILIHLKNVGEMTIFDLADACYTSPASISRLVRKMGYKNFSYFQKDLVDCMGKYDMHNRLVNLDRKPDQIPVTEYYLDTFENLFHQLRENIDADQIRRLTEMMHASEKIGIYAYSAFMSELFLQSDLFATGRICDVYAQEKDILEHIKVLTERDMVILVAPNAIEGIQADKIVTLVQRRGAKICLLSDSKRIPGFRKADLGIAVPGVLQGIDMHIMQIYLSLVALEYRRRYLDEEGYK